MKRYKLINVKDGSIISENESRGLLVELGEKMKKVDKSLRVRTERRGKDEMANP